MKTAMLLTLYACAPNVSSPPITEPAPAPDRPDKPWVQRSDDDLDLALRAVCEQAIARSVPVLLQFSSEWCIDCKRLHAMSGVPPLQDELQRWATLVIDPGRFDRHRPLLDAFEVHRLATWIALRPSDCRSSVTTWPQLNRSSFEPVSGEPVTEDQLVQWLTQARGAAG
jgi:thiol-disulfide isomerase/thioredoxin